MSRPPIHYSQAPPSGPGIASVSIPTPSINSVTSHHLHRTEPPTFAVNSAPATAVGGTPPTHRQGYSLPSVHHSATDTTGPSPSPPPYQSYPRSNPHGPRMQFPDTIHNHQKSDPSERTFNDRSTRATPVITRHSAELPSQPHRTPGTPAQPPFAPQDRPMEAGPHHPYSASPHDQIHYALSYPGSHPQPMHPPPPHVALAEQAHYMPPITDQAIYAHPPLPQPPSLGNLQPPSYAYYTANVPGGQPTKQKRLSRAALACEKCRERKSRCDEQKPCSSCRENNIECVYRDGPPSKASEKTLATSLQEAVETLLRRAERQESRMSRIETLLTGRKSSASASPKMEDEAGRDSRRDTPAADEQRSRQTTTTRPHDKNTGFEKHTTAAHKLINNWPSIHKLLVDDQPRSEMRKFAESLQGDCRRWNHIMQSEARGPLRLYGHGEADEMGDQEGFGAPSPAHSGSDESVTPSDSPWPSYSQGPEARKPDFASVGGLGPDGRLDLTSGTITRLFDSYKRHIHRLHPFLDLNTLTKFINHFKRRYSPDLIIAAQSPYAASNTALMNGTAEFARPNKRKRSEPTVSCPPSATDESIHSWDNNVARRQPDRTLRVAIVYLVLALGRTCEFRDVLPGPNYDERPYNYFSPTATRPSPSSPRSSFESPASETLLSRSRSEYSSFTTSSSIDKRIFNVERIPGLAYYREACSILGDFADSNELALAQARLLAGLYKGQFARVQESWSWIFDASRICRYWIKREGLDEVRVDKEGKPIEKYAPGSREHRRENMLLLVVWSCLQLESDLAAELDYPHSGLLKYEKNLPYPTNVVNEDTFPEMIESSTFREESVAWYYSAQLFLRKRLNKLHHNLYGEDVAQRSPQQLVEVLLENEGILSNWKNLPSPINQWSDSDPQATDILDARLRAKYFGACYIQTRFYLDYVLHVMDPVAAGKSLEEATVDAFGRLRPSEMAIFRAIQLMSEYRIKDNARKCVQMAINSTIAFDRVPGRLVVTNIMGTAHAQWGNMLVLSAAYSSNKDFLVELISKPRLHELFVRTVKFLGRIRKTSKTATKDIEILQAMHRKLFGYSVDESTPSGGRFEATTGNYLASTGGSLAAPPAPASFGSDT